MKYIYCILLASVTILSTSAQGSDKDGFISLFDGTSLNGWTASKENPESFSVSDNSIICKGGRSHLFYTGPVGNADFSNFELKLKVKTTKQSNSGVYFHTKYQEEGWPSVGFEAQVNSTHTDPRKTGSLYGIVNIWAPGPDSDHFVVRVNERQEVFIHQNAAPSKDGEWFDYHVLVRDSRIQISVNGTLTVDWIQPKGWDRNQRLGSGTVGLQAHDPDSEIHYRDIAIKILE